MERVPLTLIWRDAGREPVGALVALVAMLAGAGLASLIGVCGALLLPFLCYPLTLKWRRVKIGLCAGHAGERRWMHRLTAVSLLVTVTAGSLLLWMVMDSMHSALTLYGQPLAFLAFGGAAMLLLRAALPGPVTIQAAGPDRLLLEAAPAFTLSLPPDPLDSLPAPAAGTAPAPAALPAPDTRASPVFNPFEALPVVPVPALSHTIARDSAEVVAPDGAAWPDRCVCCARPAHGRRAALHLLPLPWPLSRLSLPLGRLLSPFRPPAAMIGLCGWHRALQVLGWALLAGVMLLPSLMPLLLTGHARDYGELRFGLICSGVFGALISLYLLDTVTLLGRDPHAWRLRLPAPFLTVLPAISAPAAPPAARPAPPPPGSSPTAPPRP